MSHACASYLGHEHSKGDRGEGGVLLLEVLDESGRQLQHLDAQERPHHPPALAPRRTIQCPGLRQKHASLRLYLSQYHAVHSTV